MSARIVEPDNVSGMQPRDEPTANEVDELRAVDRAVKGLVSQDVVGAHGTDDADILSALGRLVSDDAQERAPGRPSRARTTRCRPEGA